MLAGPEWNAALNEQMSESGDANRVAFVCWWRAVSIACSLILQTNSDHFKRWIGLIEASLKPPDSCEFIHMTREVDHKGMDSDLIEAEKFLLFPLCEMKFPQFESVTASTLAAKSLFISMFEMKLSSLRSATASALATHQQVQSLLDSFSELLGNMFSLSQKSLAENWKLLERPVALLFSLLRRARLLHVAARVCRVAPHDLPALHALLRFSLCSLSSIPPDRAFAHPCLSTRTSPCSSY